MKTGKIAMLVILAVMLLILIAEFGILIIRAFSPTQLDDVTPGIQCDEELLEKSDVFFVIPKFEGVGIGNNSDWCEKIILYDKKLEMHGVYHTFNEFGTERDANYVDEGIIEFARCFGEKPLGFKAPQMEMLGKNKKVVAEMGLRNYGDLDQILHKTYHCSDTGIISNALTEII
jgi:hypothetical protein